MKKMIRIGCLILAVLLIFPATAYATEASTYGSRYFSAMQTYIYEADSGQLGVWFYVIAKRDMNKLGADYVQVERSRDKSSWTTVATFHDDNNPSMLGENRFTYGSSVFFTPTSGYYYRALVRFYAKEGTATATYSWYTDSYYA